MRRLFAAAWLATTAVLPAEAALVTRSFSFTASDFGPGAPTDPVTATVTLTGDDTGASSGIAGSFAMTLNSITYATAEFVTGVGNLVVGSDCSGFFCSVVADVDGFSFKIDDWASATPIATNFFYSDPSTLTLYFATSVAASLVDAAPVPTPSALALSATLLGGLVLVARHRRVRLIPAAAAR